MALARHSRSRAELRKKPRRAFQYAAKIFKDTKSRPLACTISDISESGARLTLDGGGELSDRFVLLFTRNGSTRRRCRVVWRSGSTVGVAFTTD
jgi:hypothetical protein